MLLATYHFIAMSYYFSLGSSHCFFSLLEFLHPMPHLLRAVCAANPPTPLNSPKKVKNQPFPITSISGCKTATATADNAQRDMFPAVAAVLGVLGNASTSKALKDWVNQVAKKPWRNCNMRGTATWA